MALKKSAVTNPPIKDVLVCFDFGDPRILKFWLLTLCALISCFLWLLYFAWIAGLSMNQATPALDKSRPNQQSLPRSYYIDVFLALGTGFAIDATAIVFNFNRLLIQQFHYFISLRMVLLAILISVSLPLLIHYKSPTLWGPAALIVAGGSIYASFIIITDRLHKLFTGRYISARRGTMSEFVKNTCLVDMTWTRCLIAAVANLWLYLFLVRAVPVSWAPLIPVIQIAFEPIFHYLVGAAKTPRYNMTVAPLLHASNCFEWGLRQVIETPRLAVAPSTYLGLILVSRLLLDLHLSTVFGHRKDLQWARETVLPSTLTLVGCLTTIMLVEKMGIPIATYIKPIVVAFMDAAGFLAHILPSSYAIAFGGVKVIK